MKRTMLGTTAIALGLLLAACGSSEDGAQNTADEVATAEEMNASAAQASTPFSDSEMKMNEKMMAAVGVDVGDTWVRKMIEHHQGAIDMSQIVLGQNPRPDVAEMARMTVEKQGKEIEDLRKMVKEGSPNTQSAGVYQAASRQMHSAMMAATGADISETFLRKMLEHHKGGVAMSDAALANGVSGALRQQVQKTRDDQQKEAQMVEAMLRGETMSHAMQEAGVKSAKEAKAEPAPAAKSSPATKAEPKSTPKATRVEPKTARAAEPKPAPKAPASTCLPEHRALGHC